MKKNAMQREFKKLKGQINHIEEIVAHSKVGSLIEHEAAIRKKLQLLKSMENEGFKDFKNIFHRYEELFYEISIKLLDEYNKKNNSIFDFHEVIRGNYNTFINLGILNLLIKNHIPKLIAEEFNRVFPQNPKDEYLRARNIGRKFYIHLGDTNTGKTHNAIERLKKARKGIYLSPLRILALENFERLNNDGIVCDLLTGEEEIIKLNSTHISCTIEKANLNANYDIAVIDEIQMINDLKRGAAWSRALLGLNCEEIHICGAENSKKIIKKILDDCDDDYDIIEYKRKIPLEIDKVSFNFKDAEEGDAIVVFSKKKVLNIAENFSKNGERVSIIYGDLPPEVRKKQYEDFVNKETKVLVTTDAIGMGVNLPIKRIIFLDIKKFDGDEIRELKSQEVKQIAGRAGRIGIYDVGYVKSIGENWSFLKDRIEEKDEWIKEAVVGPSEAILDIKELRLREKLALWSSREEKLNYYKKMDINDYLIILDRIKSYNLSDLTEWKLLKVAFDVSKEDLLEQFIAYVIEHLVSKQKTITKPECFIETLDQLELYYQRINMYYAFSKVFNLDFDLEWVYSERLRVSEEINNLLKMI